jgi:hypothetical protein
MDSFSRASKTEGEEITVSIVAKGVLNVRERVKERDGCLITWALKRGWAKGVLGCGSEYRDPIKDLGETLTPVPV